MNRIINIDNIENNVYYKNNKQLFIQLIDILKTKRRAIITINANTELNNWINTVTVKLKDKEYSLQTKIYWIINNCITFPICPTCGKSLEHKNVFRIFNQCRYTYCNIKCCTNNENEKLKIKKTLNTRKQLDIFFQKKINKKREQTCLKKYGVKFVSQDTNIKNKIKETCLKKYNSTSYLSSISGKERIQKKLLDKYNVINAFQSDEIKQKIKQTKKERYGSENYVNVEKIKQTLLQKYGSENYVNVEKIKQTKKERYGSENYNNIEKNKQTKIIHQKNDPNYNKKIIEKREKTCLKKYGVRSTNMLQSVKNKKEQTCLKHFGVKSQNQSAEIRKKQMSHYLYNNIYFDSKPELALYIYLMDNNIDFVYQPSKNTYSYIFNGKIYFYFPDFLINNQLVEIKGSHMVDKISKKWICPWNKNLNDLYEEKHQYLLSINVKILYTQDYEKYLKYIDEKYGKNYLRQFKCKK